MKKKLISFEKIVKKFGDNLVIDGLSLDVNSKEVFGLIGRSGCGKTTLLKILIGVYPVTSGKIIYEGSDITGHSEMIRNLVGLTTQENSFYKDLSIYENMFYYARLYGVDQRQEKIDKILKDVELYEKRNLMAGRISGGMKRRLDFAISLIHDPALLILDEPTTGLDPILVKQFWDVVKRIKKQGKTIIVISHIFDELRDNCDRVGIMHSKKIKKVFRVNKKTNLAEVFKKETR